MTDEQVMALMVAILIGSEKIARASKSAYGHTGVKLTNDRAIEIAKSILKKV